MNQTNKSKMAPASAMTCSDYLGFTAMTVLLVGALNWGVLAIRYSTGHLALSFNESVLPMANLTEMSGRELYDNVCPTQDLLSLLSASASVQMFVYYLVFASGIFYLGLFVYMSIETRSD